jgi:hypothetical protein
MDKLKPKLPPIVEVTWRDAYISNTAGTADDTAKEPAHSTRYSVGWCIRADEERVVLALTYDPPSNADESAEYDDRLFIPRAYVASIRYVRGGPRRRKKQEEQHDKAHDK